MKWKCHRRWRHPILFIFSFFLKKNIFAFVSLGLCDCVLDVLNSLRHSRFSLHFNSIVLEFSDAISISLSHWIAHLLVERPTSHNRWSHAKFAHLIVRLSVRKCGLICDKCNQFGNEKEIHADTHTIHTSKCKFWIANADEFKNKNKFTQLRHLNHNWIDWID